MDIFAHGLWAGAAYKAANLKHTKPFSVRLAAWWGVFPDLFAFTIPFVWLLWSVIAGDMSLGDLPRAPHHDIEPSPRDTLPVFVLADALYHVSHSAVIFFLIFGLVWTLARRPVWELGGWLIHIVLDVPTHSYAFFPTPFLWPLSEWKFDGLSWGTPWFMVFNYSALLLVYGILWLKRKRV